MNSFFLETFGETAGPVISLAVGIVVVAIAIWLAWLLLKRFRSGLFISGGSKGRMPRLAVTDAVPVDSHRRLILVRRDDVEHLIMIGGPTDVVVESGIAKAVVASQQAGASQPVARLPVQNAQPPALAPTPPRPAMTAARDAVTEAERGRPVRGNDSVISDRRAEPILPPNPPVATLPASTSPAPAFQTPRPPSASYVPGAASGAQDLNMDSLINDLKLNPSRDR